jgi:hypothetical protein
MSSRGFWQGMEKGTANLADTGFKLMQFQANQNQRAEELMVAKDRLKLEQEAAQRQATAFQHEETKRLEQEKLDNAYTPLSLATPGIMKLPKTRQMMIDTAKSAGFDIREGADGEIYVPNKAIRHMGNLLKTNTDFMKQTLDNSMADLEAQNATISQQIAELQQKGGKEKELAPLMEQQKALKGQIAGIIGSQQDVIKAETVAKAKQNDIKTVGRDIVDVSNPGAPKLVWRSQGGGGTSAGGSESKAQKQAIKRLDGFMKQNSDDIRRARQVGADTTNLEEANRLITETKAQVLNGELDPKEIQWDRKVDRGQITSGKGATPKADKFASVVAEAKAAIAKGADRKAVLDRLKKMGYTGSL